jgi:hypothetical protein
MNRTIALDLASKVFVLNSGDCDVAFTTLDKRKGIYIGTLLALLKDVLKQGVFEWLQQVQLAFLQLLSIAGMGSISAARCFCHLTKSE